MAPYGKPDFTYQIVKPVEKSRVHDITEYNSSMIDFALLEQDIVKDVNMSFKKGKEQSSPNSRPVKYHELYRDKFPPPKSHLETPPLPSYLDKELTFDEKIDKALRHYGIDPADPVEVEQLR